MGRNSGQVPASHFLLWTFQSNFESLQEVWIICEEEDKSHGLIIN